jgi:hypothetical protein
MVVAVLAVAAVALPAYAFEVSWGGVFRTRILSDNYFTGSDSPNVPAASSLPSNISGWYGQYNNDTTTAFNPETGYVTTPGPNYNPHGYAPASSDHYNRIDTRARFYMYVTASENLRVVTRYELGDIVWGNAASGGDVHADGRIVEVKNTFIQFNIPHTPVQGTVGVQGIALLNSWLLDNDYSAAVLSAKLNPVNIQFGYIGAQNEDAFTQSSNIDDVYLNVDYNNGPFAATVVGFYQDGHDTTASIDPQNNIYCTQFSNAAAYTLPGSFLPGYLTARNNNLFDLGVAMSYKMDWMNVYVNFLKNFGSVDLYNADGSKYGSKDYKGWVVDAGGNAFYGPYSFSLKGFYATGPDIQKNSNSPEYGQLKSGADANWFVQPYGATTVYTSELMGGGILDNNSPFHENYQWTSYGGVPSNLYGLSLGAAWQALPTTKLSAAYWYFGNPNDVVSGYSASTGKLKFDSSVGNEFDFYLTQDIVDGLKLDLVAAYMISGNAYSQYNDDPNPYELGARIQWSF